MQCSKMAAATWDKGVAAVTKRQIPHGKASVGAVLLILSWVLKQIAPKVAAAGSTEGAVPRRLQWQGSVPCSAGGCRWQWLRGAALAVAAGSQGKSKLLAG